MAFDRRNYNVEEFLTAENDNLLQKVCDIFDESGRLVEQRKTRIHIYPVGQPSTDGQKSISAPCLRRFFIYTDAGTYTTTVPEIVEWTLDCELRSRGESALDPVDPSLLGPNVVIVPTQYEYDEQLVVPYNVETTIVSVTVPVDKKMYLRKVEGSGDNKGTYHVYIDGVRKRTKRSWWTGFNVDFDFSSADGGLFVGEGSTVTLKVINDSNSAETFDGSIGYVLS